MSIKDLQKHIEEREKLANRPDFRTDLGKPRVSYGKHKRLTHIDKMYRYRDQLLPLLQQQNISNELFNLFDRRSEDKIHSEEENTVISVFSDLIQYIKACNRENITGIPVSDASLDFYLAYLTSKSRKKATIDRHIASLAKWHHWLELDDFRKTYRASDSLKRTRKLTRSAQKQAEAIQAEYLFEAQEIFNSDALRDCGDIALLFVAFYTMARRSELVAFHWNDLSINSQDKSGTLYLESSKTDKEADGEYLYISPLTVGILMHWQKKCGQKQGRIFRGVDSSGSIGEYLSEKGVERAMKRIARRLGFNYSAFSGHSTRVGAAQEMLANNIGTAQIMAAGRWKTERMIVAYTRKLEASRGAAAALANILEKPKKEEMEKNLLNEEKLTFIAIFEVNRNANWVEDSAIVEVNEYIQEQLTQEFGGYVIEGPSGDGEGHSYRLSTPLPTDWSVFNETLYGIARNADNSLLCFVGLEMWDASMEKRWSRQDLTWE
jgi:site-specific recombinase XerD